MARDPKTRRRTRPANSRTCRRRRAGANGWAGSRRSFSPPPSRSLRESPARVVGKACNLDLIIDDIRDELRGRPYEIVSVAGGWSFRTKLGFGDAIRAALGGREDERIVEGRMRSC